MPSNNSGTDSVIAVICQQLTREQYIGFLLGNQLDHILRLDTASGDAEGHARKATYHAVLLEEALASDRNQESEPAPAPVLNDRGVR